NVAAYPHIIPADNPFPRGHGGLPEIWAWGFRNPFTSAVNPVTGTLFVNDVGEDTWEEIDRIRRAGNFGWPMCEGACAKPNLINPIYSYSHFRSPRTEADAITGGTFYEATRFPAFHGKYFFADIEKGFVRMLDPSHPRHATALARGLTAPLDLDV